MFSGGCPSVRPFVRLSVRCRSSVCPFNTDTDNDTLFKIIIYCSLCQSVIYLSIFMDLESEINAFIHSLMLPLSFLTPTL